MLKSYGWWVVVAYRILVSAPVPNWVYLGWNWVGLDWDCVWGDWGLRGWGLGLDNFLCSSQKKFSKLTLLLSLVQSMACQIYQAFFLGQPVYCKEPMVMLEVLKKYALQQGLGSCSAYKAFKSM